MGNKGTGTRFRSGGSPTGNSSGRKSSGVGGYRTSGDLNGRSLVVAVCPCLSIMCRMRDGW